MAHNPQNRRTRLKRQRTKARKRPVPAKEASMARGILSSLAPKPVPSVWDEVLQEANKQ